MAEAEAAPATQALLKGSPDGIVIGDIPVTDPGFAGEVTHRQCLSPFDFWTTRIRVKNNKK